MAKPNKWFTFVVSIVLLHGPVQGNNVLVVEEGKERLTPWYLFFQTDDANSCASECFKAESCASWNWNEMTTDCFLNKKYVEASDQQGMYSGYLVRDGGEDEIIGSLINARTDSLDNMFDTPLKKKPVLSLVKTTQLGPQYSPIVICPTLGISAVVPLRDSFTFTGWVWLWRASPLKNSRTSTQSTLLSSQIMGDQTATRNRLTLAPTILLNVGEESDLKSQYYFAAHASANHKNKLEYHGHYSGVSSELGQWTHLALTHHPKRGMQAFVNGQVVIKEDTEWTAGAEYEEVDMLVTLGGKPQDADAPHGLVSGGRVLTGKALEQHSVILEMEHTQPPPPPAALMRHVVEPPSESRQVDVGHEFGVSRCINMVGSGLHIELALYRPLGGGKGEDVTATLRHVARKKAAREALIGPFHSYNDLFGDPFPNFRKELFIRWSGAGQVHRGVWEEGQKVDLVLKNQCPLLPTLHSLPYYLAASWNTDVNPDADHPGLSSRYSSQVLLGNAMDVVVGPLASYRTNRSESLFLTPRLLKDMERHYTDLVMYSNTTTLLTAGAKWEKVRYFLNHILMLPYLFEYRHLIYEPSLRPVIWRVRSRVIGRQAMVVMLGSGIT